MSALRMGPLSRLSLSIPLNGTAVHVRARLSDKTLYGSGGSYFDALGVTNALEVRSGADLLVSDYLVLSSDQYGATINAAGYFVVDDAFLVRPVDPVGYVRFDVSALPSPDAYTVPLCALLLMPPLERPLTLTLTGADAFRTLGLEGRYTLNVDVLYLSGVRQTQQFTLELDNTAPIGDITFLTIPGYGGFLASSRLSGDTRSLSLLWADGSTSSVNVGVTPVTVLSVERVDNVQLLEVRGVDDVGNVSGNLLRRVARAPDFNVLPTALSPWPLPTYMDGERPNLKALLETFSTVLDLHPDEVGEAFNPARASGVDLERLAWYYGLEREGEEDDYRLARRIFARLLERKSTRGGLERVGKHFGADYAVVDDLTRYSGLRRIDGSWLVDGSIQLGGTILFDPIGPGQIRVLFDEEPAIGFGAAIKLISRYRAAGVVSQYVFRKTAVFEAVQLSPSLRPQLKQPRRDPLRNLRSSFQGFRVANALLIDGTWQLSGANVISGSRSQAGRTEF